MNHVKYRKKNLNSLQICKVQKYWESDNWGETAKPLLFGDSSNINTIICGKFFWYLYIGI
jgi:hypothetical protein